MSRRTSIAILTLAAALLLSGPAFAGTADDPEVTDAALDATGPANLYADLTKGWLEQAGDVLTAHTEVARIDALQVGVAYIMTFDVDGDAYYVGLIHFDTTRYFTGTWNRDAHAPGAADDVTGTFQAGSPAHITVDFATDAFGRNVTSLQNVGLEVIDFKASPAAEVYVPLDIAVSEKAFQLASPPWTPIDTASTDAPTPAANVPLPFWVPILAALGLAAIRRRA